MKKVLIGTAALSFAALTPAFISSAELPGETKAHETARKMVESAENRRLGGWESMAESGKAKNIVVLQKTKNGIISQIEINNEDWNSGSDSRSRYTTQGWEEAKMIYLKQKDTGEIRSISAEIWMDDAEREDLRDSGWRLLDETS